MNPDTLETIAFAHRFLYYVLDKPQINDWEYDQMEKRALQANPLSSLGEKVGSSNPEDYTDEQINMAFRILALNNFDRKQLAEMYWEYFEKEE